MPISREEFDVSFLTISPATTHVELFLAQHTDQAFTMAELMEELWPGITPVEERLAQFMSLQRLLEDLLSEGLVESRRLGGRLYVTWARQGKGEA